MDLDSSSAPETNGIWVAAALAVGTLVVSISQTRRAVGSKGMLHMSIALSTVTLVAVASRAVFLVSATDVVAAVDDVPTVQPSDG